MCGIIGITGRSPVAERLISALQRLEYRGYDSAGIAVAAPEGLVTRRAVGKLEALKKRLEQAPVDGPRGIGHTRWATHGPATEANAHPHRAGPVALVHNGIIENFRPLKDELAAKGVSFSSDTDTEVTAHLIAAELRRGLTPLDAFEAVLQRLEGAFALVASIEGADGQLFVARRGSPVVVGLRGEEALVGSDATALAGICDSLIYLEEGDWGVLSPGQIRAFDASGAAVDRPAQPAPALGGFADKGNHRHFMHKEIHEQPTVIAQTLGRYVDPAAGVARLPALPIDAADITKITLLACGTAYYAGLTALYWLEDLTGLPVSVDIASEYRYRQAPILAGELVILISQSGETADTVAAMRHAKSRGGKTLGVVNVPTSTLAREADATLPTFAGAEIGVASTKAYTCQLAALAAFALGLAAARGQRSAAEQRDLIDALEHVPALMAGILSREGQLAQLARALASARDVFYVGRGAMFPTAMEGALKLKEISYIHAEGYAGGELKHGPIALIDEEIPVIGLAPGGGLFGKTVSNLEEIRARGGRIILVSDQPPDHDGYWGLFKMPAADPFILPILYALPMQLLAYHTAVEKGTDVDQPRNLAKSVTVE